MVDRGHCKFTTKANNAEAAGASAILIINNQKGNHTFVFVIVRVCVFWATLHLQWPRPLCAICLEMWKDFTLLPIFFFIFSEFSDLICNAWKVSKISTKKVRLFSEVGRHILPKSFVFANKLPSFIGTYDMQNRPFISSWICFQTPQAITVVQCANLYIFI